MEMFCQSKAPMNEFKFACPVCGQHMMCDSTQGGSVMECPTCFQKIVAPQAPGPDVKFILTGTKYSEKKIPDSLLRAAGSTSPVKKAGPLAAILLVILLAASGAAVAIYHKQLLKALTSATSSGTAGDQSSAGSTPPPPPPKKEEKPAPVAPPANDTNWMLALASTDPIPDTPVAGRIHGQDFIMERATFSNGNLTIRSGTKGPLEFGMQINFAGAQPESLSGHSINVTTNADKAAKITFHWQDTDGTAQKDNYEVGYAMRLEFGALANNRLPGKIYLCTPDDTKSYLMGSFKATVPKPKPKPAQ